MGEAVFSWFLRLAVLQRYKLFRTRGRIFFLFLRLVWLSVWFVAVLFRSLSLPCYAAKRYMVR